MSVGMPAMLLLHEFGSQVWAAFGSPPFLVGSALTQKRDWRDVDVRLMLDDATWERLQLGNPDHTHMNGRWVSLCLAYSALGKQITGLPIDFQIQPTTWANARYPGPRESIGGVPLRWRSIDKSNTDRPPDDPGPVGPLGDVP